MRKAGGVEAPCADAMGSWERTRSRKRPGDRAFILGSRKRWGRSSITSRLFPMMIPGVLALFGLTSRQKLICQCGLPTWDGLRRAAWKENNDSIVLNLESTLNFSESETEAAKTSMQAHPATCRQSSWLSVWFSRCGEAGSIDITHTLVRNADSLAPA